MYIEISRSVIPRLRKMNSEVPYAISITIFGAVAWLVLGRRSGLSKSGNPPAKQVRANQRPQVQVVKRPFRAV